MAEPQQPDPDQTAPPAGSTASVALVDPRRPHDDLPFEELAGRYNFRLTSTHGKVITRLVIEECQRRPSPVRVLDIGCGRGIGRHPEYQWAIRPHVGEYWGIEPDETVAPADGLFDHHQHALLETASLPADHFDIAYSCMVMEHVARPDEFMRALLHCLRPGGVYLFVTPNRRHYFTRLAILLHALRLDELILRVIKRSSVDEYHYRVCYRFNVERQIDSCAGRLGFLPPEYAYLEPEGPSGYMRGPLKPVFHLLAYKRKLIKNPRALITLVCRIKKPG